MVVAKACKDEHTYQKGNRGESAKSSLMNKSVSLSKTKFQLLGSNVRKTCLDLIPTSLYIENLGVVIDLVTSPGFMEINEF